ncbi:gastrula zinc finger protein XlCGF26.1-like [Rhinatrema bivittatum]|uniref:gastrula zinc finger protein XlCGF26.1-like n=1 Tax=Rhinatrema bivittatum TaxID=194408 RepID=UPI00112A1AE5|nr:gastrula zinc finger protein XlCGF26.1-like [Rhinatrema bivittatum]
MPAGASAQCPVTFEDIAVYFSQEEWEDLEEQQKELYKDVMMENFESLIAVGTGSPTITPDIISCIERGEDPYIRDEPGSEERGTGRSSCSEIDGPRNCKSGRDHWKLSENLDGKNMLSEGDREDSSSYSKWGSNQCISEMRQINSTGNSVCKQSARNITYKGEEERNQASKQRCLCDVCGIFLRDPVTLKSHQSFHTEEKPSTCTDCGKTFNQKGELLEQEKPPREEKPFICSECGIMRLLEVTEYGKNVIVNANLKSYQKSHPEENHFLHNKSVFEKKVHTDEKHFSCTKCNKCFSKKEALKRHLKIHTGVKEFTCIECGKSFWEKGNFIRHQKIHTGVKPFTCTECGVRFTQKSTLTLHQRIHTRDKIFICEECGKSFKKDSYLIIHQKIHKGVKPFICEECGKSFGQQWYLTNHQKIHKEVEAFTCMECGKSFNRSSHLTKHQIIHTEVKAFICAVCDKSFRNKVSLTTHQRIHTEVKPFTCTECGVSFRCKSNLTNHQRFHKKEKALTCTECGKSFSRSSYFTHHQRIHTEVKQFTCTECGESFRYKNDFTNHQRIHTVKIAVINASQQERNEIEQETQTGILVCASNTQEKSTETRQQNKDVYVIYLGL